MNFSDFQNIFIKVLHNYGLIKKKILKFKDSPFMPKALAKAVMVRSKLRKTKKDYFNNLKVKIYQLTKILENQLRQTLVIKNLNNMLH